MEYTRSLTRYVADKHIHTGGVSGGSALIPRYGVLQGKGEQIKGIIIIKGCRRISQQSVCNDCLDPFRVQAH